MNLLFYYRELFAEASKEYEPGWEEDRGFKDGFRWRKKGGRHNTEVFQIEEWHHECPVLRFAYLLPSTYSETTLCEEVDRYKSNYELKMHATPACVVLSAALPVEKLQESMMGFVNRARSELLDILDFTIMKQ
ncbi:hypothetical protein [Paenibacillus koleovorans]|uniref:hypothetical protein n=1 Tax=Paenibacillus koleovorans TaxID=121608 RepID=UPI000FD93AC9|nr:hypothetical protein [Paenibacillus koleovorans]